LLPLKLHLGRLIITIFSVSDQVNHGWLDAQDAATITRSGDLGSSWTNKADGANNAIQATTSRQPSVAPAGIHDDPAIQFDGSDDRRTFSSAADTTPGEYHAFVVASGPQAGTSNYQRILGTPTSGPPVVSLRMPAAKKPGDGDVTGCRRAIRGVGAGHVARDPDDHLTHLLCKLSAQDHQA
jgi:hypothetical protein